jgi:cobyrinic acid a,c-diamide synthase
VVALAGGRIHSYGYAETAELLAGAGADVVPSTCCDEALPDRTAALVIGGGPPESYADELVANTRLSAAVAALARSGHPVIAEVPVSSGSAGAGRPADVRGSMPRRAPATCS